MLLVSLVVSVVAHMATSYTVGATQHAFLSRGLCGRDMSKKDTPTIPETLGLVPAVVYLVVMMGTAPWRAGRLAWHLAGVLCVQAMVLLGLVDDLFDVRWRHKFFLPAIAAIPLLVVYGLEYNITTVLVPKFVNARGTYDLGWFYYFYMASVAIFCPNSVNILAGVNGLEVGQTLVIALLLVCNDLYYVFWLGNASAQQVHLDSLYLLLPFIAVGCALLKYNWYPARVFVGDTWCYFAGMVLAVAGISCHYAKTLLMFFIPQVFNFVYSVPQLVGWVPCPRHRMPKFNAADNKLYNSWTEYTKDKPLRPRMAAAFNIMEKVGLIKLRREKGQIVASTNMTLINLFLIWFGPMREDQLCSLILFSQFLFGFLMLLVRHTMGPYVFGFDNSKV